MNLIETAWDMNKINEYILFSSKEPRTIDDALEFSNQIISRFIKDFSIKDPSQLRFAYSYPTPTIDSTFSTPHPALQEGILTLTSENIARLLSEKYAVNLPVFNQMENEDTPLTLYKEPELDLLLPGVTDNQIRIGGLTSITQVPELGYNAARIKEKWYSLIKSLTPWFTPKSLSSLKTKIYTLREDVATFEKTPHVLPVAYFAKLNKNN